MKQYKTVYDLLKAPSRWTKFVAARNKKDQRVSVESPDACKFCLVGAIDKIYKIHDKRILVRNKVRDIIYRRYFSTISSFNDYTAKHKDIIEICKLAKI